MRPAMPEQCSTLIVSAMIALALVLASETRGERLPIKPYSVVDGLPQESVGRIRQDSQGFIWFCTTLGISRFDGYGFTNYGTKDGLSFPGVNDIVETRSGSTG